MKARTVPSVSDITEAKSQKILTEVLDVLRNQDLASSMAIIEAKMEEEDCTAIELAAAFLRNSLGEEKEEIPAVSYEEERKKRKRSGRGDKLIFDVRRGRGDNRRNGGDNRRGEGGREVRHGDNRREDRRNERRRGADGRREAFRDMEERKAGKKRPERNIKLRMDGSIMEERPKRRFGKKY